MIKFNGAYVLKALTTSKSVANLYMNKIKKPLNFGKCLNWSLFYYFVNMIEWKMYRDKQLYSI